MNLTGELAALSAACLWAIASVAYAWIGRRVPPLGLNLAKGWVAIALILLTLFLRGDFLRLIVQGSAVNIAPTNLGFLLLSGLVGIGFGDTVYFQALSHLGPRRTLLLGTLAPPLTAGLGLIFLKEFLPPLAWLGIGFTLAGVIWVISERTPTRPSQSLTSGIGFAFLAALAQAIGAILSRAALAGTTVDPLWSALLRLLAGVLALSVWGLLRQELGQWLKGFSSAKLLVILMGAAFGGTYLGIWLQQVALKFTAAGVAQTLGATSPLFVLPIAAGMGESISFRTLLGVLLALGGIAVLFGFR